MAASVLLAAENKAEFKFASVCSDDMVIQRDIEAPVWGFAAPGANVVVSLNGKQVGEATADEKGRWLVKLPAQKANKNPSKISAECGGKTIEIGNVLFGDVWFGCGQSNMAYTFNGYGRLPIGGDDFIKKAAGNPCVRTLLMSDGANKNCGFPRKDAVGIKWETSTPESIRKNGAALYWMGYKLNQELDIPIGLVNASWGATKIDGWLDSEWAKKNGTGYAKGIGNFWCDRRQKFEEAGGEEVYKKKLKEYIDDYVPAKNYLKGEPGYKEGTPTLHDADFDDSKWVKVEPGENGFQAAPFPEGFEGEVWLRAVFEFSEEDVKKGWSIGYSESYGQDMTYLNGKAFGGSGNPNHGYGMPKDVYKVGTNVLVIQYKVWGGKDGKKGGMHKPMKIAVWPNQPKTIPLELKALIGKFEPKARVNPPENPGLVNMFTATSMHNGLVEPLYPMALKGCVWYQGCSDLGNGRYDNMFENMVGAWRARFTYKDKLPVIITEIAPHQLDTKPNSQGRIDAGETKSPTWSVSADMRRDLMELGDKVPDCGTVSLLDLGEPDIHPIRKEEVGDRWCRWALANVYGKNIIGAGPSLTSVEWQGAKAVLKFKNAKGLKTSDGKPVTGFEISGPVFSSKDKDGKPKDGVLYYYADAKIVDDTIELTHPEVKEAFSVRYA